MNTYVSIKKGLLSMLALLLFVSGNLVAHTDNETTLFPDIKTEEARFDITLLVSIGIIPKTANFHPGNRLGRLDLAAWSTLAAGLAEAGDKPDIEALADIALNKGLIESIDGNASYDDINTVLFKGQLRPESPGATPTRAEAAEYIAANLSSGIPGKTLLDSRDMYFGPTGEVTKVDSRVNPDGGESFFITIGGQTYPMYTHGKLANGPTDLKQWQERTVRRSVVRKLGQLKLWVFLEAEGGAHPEHDHSTEGKSNAEHQHSH